jgi:hypothetical protein
MRFAEEAFTISEAVGVPLALAIKATNVAKLAVKMKVNIVLYIVKKGDWDRVDQLRAFEKRYETYIEDNE